MREKYFFWNTALMLPRLLLSAAGHAAARVPVLDAKYNIAGRLRGPWLRTDRASSAAPALPHLWLHGASLGECKMLLSVARALKHDLPQCPPMLLTTQKAEAVDVLAKIGGDICEVAVAPADLPSALRRFAKEVNPVALILGENELWPGYISLMKKIAAHSVEHSVAPSAAYSVAHLTAHSVALVSGRVRRVFPGVDLSRLGFVAMQSDCGNWKLLDWARALNPAASETVPAASEAKPATLAVDVAFVSFHKEELRAFVDLAFAAVSEGKSVVVAPRRLGEVALFQEALNSRRIRTCEWPLVEKSSVSIVARFGVVSEILKSCGAVVVGGSFAAKLGVHDFWEPLCAGAKVFVGPYSWGAEDAVSALESAGVLHRVSALESAGILHRLSSRVSAGAQYMAAASPTAASPTAASPTAASPTAASPTAVSPTAASPAAASQAAASPTAASQNEALSCESHNPSAASGLDAPSNEERHLAMAFLQGEREKILNSYKRLLEFLSNIL